MQGEMSNSDLHKFHEWVWPWPWYFQFSGIDRKGAKGTEAAKGLERAHDSWSKGRGMLYWVSFDFCLHALYRGP